MFVKKKTSQLIFCTNLSLLEIIMLCKLITINNGVAKSLFYIK